MSLDRIESIYFDALELPADQRSAFLQLRCGADTQLRVEVEALLHQHGKVHREFLDRPIADIHDLLTSQHVTPLPDPIEGFQLLHEIGRGSMGVVYLAHQSEPIRRLVAIKVLQIPIFSMGLRERFNFEQSALAAMDHPNVARIFAGGVTGGGQPYLVMEYVRGSLVTEFVQSSNCSIPERLGLMIQICNAVQHAHHKGIIHRDLKPSNILVKETDEGPAVKIIDFGIAKPRTSNNLPALTMHGEMLGTIEYMAPEQLTGHDKTVVDVDTRADVYSLGVVLFELLCDTRPFRSDSLKSVPIEQAIVIVRNFEPVAPSIHLYHQLRLQKKRGSSDHVVKDIKIRCRQIAGDLDWIVLKALQRDRDNRYSTPGDLALDIARFLSNEPVVARRPSRAYLTRKFVARHETVITLTLIVIVLFILGFAGVVSQAIRATRQERIAANNGYLAAIAASSSAIDSHDLAGAKQWLDVAAPGLRNWEWNFLKRKCDSSKHVFDNLGKPVVGVWFLDEDSKFVSCSPSGHLRLWDLKLDSCTTTFNDRDVSLSAVTLNASAGLLAGSDRNGAIHILDASDFRQIGIIPGGGHRLTNLVLSPSGKYLSATSADGIVQVFNAQSLEIEEQWHGENEAIIQLKYLANDESVVAVNQDGLLTICNSNGANQRRLEPQCSKILSLATSNDGKLIGVGDSFGLLRVWTISDGVQKGYAQINIGSAVWSIAFSYDGALLACGCQDHSIHLLSNDRSQEMAILRGHTGTVHGLWFSNNSQELLSGSADGTIRSWQVTNPELRYENTITTSSRMILSLDVDGTGEQLIAAVAGGPPLAWRLGPNSALQRRSIGTVPFDSAAMAQGAQRFIFSDSDHISLCSTDTVLRDFTNQGSGPIRCARCDETGNLIVAGTMDGTILLWSATSGELLWSRQAHGDVVTSISFATTNQFIISSAIDGTVHMWNLQGDRIATYSTNSGAVLSVAASHSGRYIAAGTAHGDLYLFETTKTSPVLKLRSGDSPITCALFSPGDDRLFSASQDSTIRVWRVDKGDLALILHGHKNRVTAMTIDSPGHLFTGDEDGYIRIWDGSQQR